MPVPPVLVLNAGHIEQDQAWNVPAGAGGPLINLRLGGGPRHVHFAQAHLLRPTSKGLPQTDEDKMIRRAWHRRDRLGANPLNPDQALKPVGGGRLTRDEKYGAAPTRYNTTISLAEVSLAQVLALIADGIRNYEAALGAIPLYAPPLNQFVQINLTFPVHCVRTASVDQGDVFGFQIPDSVTLPTDRAYVSVRRIAVNAYEVFHLGAID